VSRVEEITSEGVIEEATHEETLPEPVVEQNGPEETQTESPVTGGHDF
jgi:hypothetical protein